MFNNSNTISHLEDLNNAIRYTNNASAVSIYSELNEIIKPKPSPNENMCELNKVKKHSYTKSDLFKIRNSESDRIKERVPRVIAQNLAYKKNQPLDFSNGTCQLLSLKDIRYGQEKGKLILDIIRNSAKSKEEKTSIVPNTNKSDPLQQFLLDHPEFLSENSAKRKCPALTVQEVESNLICTTKSAITVQELESMQLNQTIYESDISKETFSEAMEVEDQSNQLDDQSEISIDLEKNKMDEKHHFAYLMKKLYR